MVKDLGAVSAYALAVEGGYKGTEAEFSAELAQCGNNAKQVAADKAVVTGKATETVEAAAQAKLSETNAKGSEDRAKTSETNSLASETKTQQIADSLVGDVKIATDNANKMAEDASKVNISSIQNPTGVTIITTDRTGAQTETTLDTIVALKSWKDIETVVRQGKAKKLIQPGDIFVAPRKDPNNGRIYDVPHHICGIRNVETPKGEIKEAVIVQPHKVLPEDAVFDSYEAFYAVKEKPLEAGTYHVTMKETWSKITQGDSWSFTLTQPVPVGGVLTGFRNAPDVANLAETTVSSYAKLTDADPIESVALRKGAEGTKLGDFEKAGNAQLNSIQKVAYGNNNWKESFQRQYLNNTGKGWWVPQNDYDCPPDNFTSKYGYMTGWDEEFLGVLKPFKAVTVRNNVTDGGGEDITYDKFVLPSLEEMYIKKQSVGEGEAFPYWIEAVGLPAPREWYQATPELVHLDMNGSARYVRLRSASVYSSYNTWIVNSSGDVSYYNARGAFCSAPLAAIY